MKEKRQMKNDLSKKQPLHRKIITIMGILFVVLLLIGVSYAWWSSNVAQTSVNKITSDCVKITITDETAAINLGEVYPITNKEAKELTPYTFTITNTCNTLISYDVNLEILGVDNQLNSKYVSASIDNGAKKKLESLTSLTPTYKDNMYTANEARNLLSRRELAGKESQTYDLRLWMDEDTTVSKETINKNFKAKVSIVASLTEPRGTLMVYNSTKAFYPYKENISQVIFEDELNPMETEFLWDISETQDKSVMAYLVETETSTEDAKDYILYIQGKGGIKANPNSSYLFSGFTKLTAIKGLEYLDTSNVTNMSYMFYNCSNLTELDLSHFDTSKVTNMSVMFYICNKLTKLDVSHFDTSKVTSMSFMFSDCRSLTELDVSHFDTTNVTAMNRMFYNCSGLTKLDVSHFDTSNVTNMYGMFYNCSGLTKLDVSHFDTSKVTDMSSMFYSCRSLTELNVSHFDTSKVIAMNQMFNNCSNLTKLDVSHFDTSNVTSMNDMFFNNSKLTTIVYGPNFIHKDGADTLNMFYDCPANKPTGDSWSSVVW